MFSHDISKSITVNLEIACCPQQQRLKTSPTFTLSLSVTLGGLKFVMGGF